MADLVCRAACSPPPIDGVPLGNSMSPTTARRGGHWLRALAGNTASRNWCAAHDIELKASNEGSNTTGNFLVPADYDQSILRLTEEYGCLRAFCDVRPTTSDLSQRARRVGGAQAYWTPEGTSCTESSMSWDAIEASPKKLMILGRCSAELFSDSAPSLADYFATEIAYAFAQSEDAAGFVGDGSSTYDGMSGLATKLAGGAGAVAAATGSATSWSSVTQTDVGNLVASVQASAIPDSAFYMNKKAYGSIVVRLASTAGGLVATVGPGGQINASWLGFPVRFSNSIPETAGSNLPIMFFGSLRRAVTLVERRATTVALSWQAAKGGTFESDQCLVRGTERLAIIAHDYTNGSAGPISMLVGTT
jgi:HK97 family phage major capsid protein